MERANQNRLRNETSSSILLHRDFSGSSRRRADTWVPPTRPSRNHIQHGRIASSTLPVLRKRRNHLSLGFTSQNVDVCGSGARTEGLFYSSEDIYFRQDIFPRLSPLSKFGSRTNNVFSYSSENDNFTLENSPRNPLRSLGDNSCYTAIKPRAFTYSVPNIRSRPEIFPFNPFKSVDDDSDPAFRPKAFTDAYALIRLRQDISRRRFRCSKRFASSCGDVRLGSNIPPHTLNRPQNNDNRYSRRRTMGFAPSRGDIRFGESLRCIPNHLDVNTKGLPSSSGDIPSAQDAFSNRKLHRPPVSPPKEDFDHTAVDKKSPDSRSEVKKEEIFARFVCGHIVSAGNAETQHLVTLKEKSGCFILRFNADLHAINSIYWDFKHENDGMLKRMLKKTLKRNSKRRENKFEELLAQFERDGFLEVVSPKAKHDGSINLEYKVTNGSLCRLFSTELSSQKNFHEDSGEGALSSESDTGGKTQLWKWKQSSIFHQQKFIQLREYGRDHPKDVKEINGVRVCFLEQFRIGMGSDGTRVYVGLGKDGVEKAVKRMHRDACGSSAQDEMQALTTVKSTNVINYYMLDEETEREYLYLILELCEETLENFVSRKSPGFLLAIAPEIIRQILKGLADLHRSPKPILHRDLKPSNILKTVDGKWLLADFGISRIMEKDDSTFVTNQKGTKDWMAVEACQCDGKAGDSTKVRCKKESDIQVVGMVAFYIVTKGGHPYGEERFRLDNLLKGNPADLCKVEDLSTNDLITWMLSHDPKERPSAEEALKHPYLQSEEQKFELLCRLGNQFEIKTEDARFDVVRKLNSDPKDWRTLIKSCILKYLCNGQPFRYSSSWTDCLRLIRNVMEHWHDKPRPRPEAFYLVGDPRRYFLKLFPNLPVEAHRIVRQTEWRERLDLKKYFM